MSRSKKERQPAEASQIRIPQRGRKGMSEPGPTRTDGPAQAFVGPLGLSGPAGATGQRALPLESSETVVPPIGPWDAKRSVPLHRLK
jgi:hypothetical protein